MQALSSQVLQRPAPLIVMILVVALAACSHEAPPPPVVPAVFVSPVINASGNVQRVFFGSVRPRVEAELAFRTGGKITERLVDVGQSVRAGQALAHIDPADYELAVQAAAQQERVAAVDAVQATSDAARFKRLLADGSVGAADAERQQARADAAEARLAQALKQSKLARNRAGYAVLVAPFDGVVTSVRFETGQMADDSSPVLSVAKLGELEVQVDVPESMAAGLNAWKASAHLGELAADPVPLRLRELAPSATVVTRTFRARFAFAGNTPDSDLLMGRTAEVLLQQPGRAAGAELPIGALLVTAQADGAPTAAASSANPSVWVVDSKTGALTRQPVKLLSQTTDHVRVAGLADGTLVVTVGAQKLDPGLTVRPVQRPLSATHAAQSVVATR